MFDTRVITSLDNRLMYTTYGIEKEILYGRQVIGTSFCKQGSGNICRTTLMLPWESENGLLLLLPIFSMIPIYERVTYTYQNIY